MASKGHGRLHTSEMICQTLEAGTSGGGGTSNRPMIAFTQTNGTKKWGASIPNNAGNLQIMKEPEISPTLTEAMGKGGGKVPFVVSGQTNGTNTQTQSTANISGSATSGTSEQLVLTKSPTTTYSVRDFLAKVLALLESGEDSKIQEALYSLKLLESQGLNELRIYSLKMSKDCSSMIRAIPLRQSSQPLMNWGMTFNGKCLTARISESRRIGKECSLSEILEEQPDQKYFLSEKSVKFLIRRNEENKKMNRGFQVRLVQDMGRCKVQEKPI